MSLPRAAPRHGDPFRATPQRQDPHFGAARLHRLGGGQLPRSAPGGAGGCAGSRPARWRTPAPAAPSARWCPADAAFTAVPGQHHDQTRRGAIRPLARARRFCARHCWAPLTSPVRLPPTRLPPAIFSLASRASREPGTEVPVGRAGRPCRGPVPDPRLSGEVMSMGRVAGNSGPDGVT